MTDDILARLQARTFGRDPVGGQAGSAGEPTDPSAAEKPPPPPVEAQKQLVNGSHVHTPTPHGVVCTGGPPSCPYARTHARESDHQHVYRVTDCRCQHVDADGRRCIARADLIAAMKEALMERGQQTFVLTPRKAQP